MLWSKADGTPALVEAIKIAVPGTRWALPLADLMKISIGIVLSAMRSRIKARPRDQVVSKVKMINPMTSDGDLIVGGPYETVFQKLFTNKNVPYYQQVYVSPES